MAPSAAIAVQVITGFLGSGKTTLLNALLGTPGLADTVVIVNEFGDIGLDHLLIETARDAVVLLEGGCLCCAAGDSLRETLADLYQRRQSGALPRFRRVVIETSGLADPGPILQSLMCDPLLADRFAPRGLICVVDALHWEASLRAPEALAQVALADRLVVSKTDLADGVPARLQARLADLAPGVPVMAAAAVGRDPGVLIDCDPVVAPRPPGHHHDHDSGIGSVSLLVDGPASWAGIAAWSEHLRRRWGAGLLRAKALLPVAGLATPVLVQAVRTSFDVTRLGSWPDAERRGRVVLIGPGIDPDAAQRGVGWLMLPDGGPYVATAGFPDRPEEERAEP